MKKKIDKAMEKLERLLELGGIKKGHSSFGHIGHCSAAQYF